MPVAATRIFCCSSRGCAATLTSGYLPGSGTLILYPGELQAVIAVEVLGDTRPEPPDDFYLDAFNPVGGSFGEGVVQLTAVRSIVDDDGWLG